MEVLAQVIGAILAEPCRFVFGYVQASIKNFSKRKSNFNALKNDMSSLNNLKDNVQQKMNQKYQLGDDLRSQVTDWLRQVDGFKSKVDVFLSSISTSDGNNWQDSCSPCPWQCKLSNKLARKMEEAKHLMEDGNKVFEKIDALRDTIKPVELIPGPSIIGQTASENMNRVLNLLSDDNVTRIGVWGMGGVGKTTLVEKLNNKLGEESSAQPFRVIIWVTVSKDTNVKRIHTRIAARLKLEVELDEESMKFQILDELQKQRPFLLILDDVWDAINLDHVGIPRPEQCPRSKIIITSRKLDVCTEMTQECVKVTVLNNDEAWELFREHAGDVVMGQHIRPIAQMVSKECAGLPLAIKVVGASMRRKSKIELWKDTLRALQTSAPIGKSIEDKVFEILKWSYEFLENKQTKFCFLFCCLYPEDFNIKVDDLVRYWYCEGLLDELRNYEEMKNRGVAIIQSLKDCCLLEDGIGIFMNVVKMHDVVRDVGIWIADSVEVECKSLVRSGIGLTSVSDNEFLSSYKRLSFMNNQIASLPDCGVQCPEASTLLLQVNENLDTLPASFLEGFQTLKILDLSQTGITSLPSLLQLHQLRALILIGCGSLTKLPPLDGLSRLLLLDCSASGLTELPQSLEKLSNLRRLDISETRNLKTIPYSAFSKLSNLEWLGMYWECGGSTRIEGQRLFEVLPFLKQRIVLRATLDSIPHLTSNNVNWFKGIKRFQICVRNCEDFLYWGHETLENSIILSGVSLSQESIGWLLCNAEYLRFDGCEGLTQMFNKLVTDNVSIASLKKLVISNSDISFGGGIASSFDLLPNLEEISLLYVGELESVSDLSKLLGLGFSRLNCMVIGNCEQLKCVISLEENQTLEKLKRIEVSDCKMLKSLFDYRNPREQHINLNSTAPNLQSVSLECLPNLENLWGNDESWQNVQKLKLLDCPQIRKLPLTAQNAESIKEIRGEEEWWNRLEWDSEDTQMLLQQRFRAWSDDELRQRQMSRRQREVLRQQCVLLRQFPYLKESPSALSHKGGISGGPRILWEGGQIFKIKKLGGQKLKN